MSVGIIVSAARSLTCRDDLDSKWRLLLAEKRTIACIFAVSNLWKLTIQTFFLRVSASVESIKVAEIACSTSQIKMETDATLREAL